MSIKFIRNSTFFAVTFLLASCSTRHQDNSPTHNQQFCGSYTPSPDHAKRDYTLKDPRYKVGKPYKINGRWYYPCEDFEYEEIGKASWYGPGFHGKKTANGERYNMHAMTAAHRTLPLPSLVEVTNLRNGKKAILKVTDRGPYAKDRILDISKAGALKLGFVGHGTAEVRVRILKEESMRFAGLMPHKSSRTGPRTQDVSKETLKDGTLSRYEDNQFPWQQPVQLAGLYDTKDDSRIQKDLGYLSIPEKNTNISSAQDSKSSQTPPIVLPPLVQSLPKKAVQLASLKKNQFTPVDLDGTFLTSTKPFFVQAGAFSNYQNAHAYSQKLGTMASTFIVTTQVSGKTIYRVRLGPIKTSLEANQLLGRMKNQGYSDARIVSES